MSSDLQAILSRAFDAGDVEAALSASSRHLTSGGSLQDLYLSAARAASRKYAHLGDAFSLLHALSALDAAYALRHVLPDSGEPPFSEDAGPARGLALAQTIAYLAETYPGADGDAEASKPSLTDSTLEAMASRVLDHIRAGHPEIADGMFDLLLFRDHEMRVAPWAWFTACAMNPGDHGHRLILGAHCWRMGAAAGSERRLELLRPALHYAGGTPVPADVDRLLTTVKRVALGAPPLERRRPPDHIVVIANLIMNDDAVTTLIRALDDGFGIHDLMDAIIVAAATSVSRGGNVHAFTYAHAARLAIEATDGRALLPLFQAAIRDDERWKIVPVPIAPPVAGFASPRPSIEELALWAAFEDCAPTLGHSMKFTTAAVEELQRLPEALRPYVEDAWLANVARTRKSARTVAARVPDLSSRLTPPRF